MSAAIRLVRTHVPFAAVAFATSALALLVLVAAAIAYGRAIYVAVLLAACTSVVAGLLDWRRPVLWLLAFLPVSGIPIVLAYPHTSGAVLLKDILFVVPAYLGYAAAATVRPMPNPLRGGLLAVTALFSLLAVGEVLNPDLPNLLVGAIGLKVWLFYVPMLALGYGLLRDRADLTRVLRLISLTGIVPAAVGIIEAILIAGGHATTVYGWYGPAAASVSQNFAQTVFSGGGSLQRIPSTFSFVTQYYGFTAAMVAVTYAWWRGVLAPARRGPAGLALWLVMLTAAFLSGARGAFLLVPVLVVLIVLFEGGVRGLSLVRLAAPAGMLLAAVAVLGAGVSAVVRRVFDIGVYEVVNGFIGGMAHGVASTPLGAGTGMDTRASQYAFANPRDFTFVNGTWYEGLFPKAVTELGIPGLVLFILLVVLLIRAGARAHAAVHDPRLRAISAALLAFLVWNAIYGVKGSFLDLDPVNIYFWLFAGMLLRLPELTQHDGSRA